VVLLFIDEVALDFEESLVSAIHLRLGVRNDDDLKQLFSKGLIGRGGDWTKNLVDAPQITKKKEEAVKEEQSDSEEDHYHHHSDKEEDKEDKEDRSTGVRCDDSVMSFRLFETHFRLQFRPLFGEKKARATGPIGYPAVAQVAQKFSEMVFDDEDEDEDDDYKNADDLSGSDNEEKEQKGGDDNDDDDFNNVDDNDNDGDDDDDDDKGDDEDEGDY